VDAFGRHPRKHPFVTGTQEPDTSAMLSSHADASATSDISLAAPKQWLRAWAYCFGNGETRLSSASNRDLVNCLLVCLYYWNAAFFQYEAAACFSCDSEESLCSSSLCMSFLLVNLTTSMLYLAPLSFVTTLLG
jgi:hypothetical protein